MSDQQQEMWTPQRGSQMAFHENISCFEVLYGGAAGGGKSESLLTEALRFADVPGYRAILFRRTFPELEKSLVPRAYEMLYGAARPVNKGTEWRFPNGAVLYLSHLQHEEDKEKHKSAEYDYAGFDELTSFSESQYVYIFSRVRGKNPEIIRRVRASTNPTGQGHAWVKQRFIDLDNNPDMKRYASCEYEFAHGWKVAGRVYTSFSDLPEHYETGDPAFSNEIYYEYKEIKSGLTRAFIPALLWGNAKLLKADPTYVNRLRGLPANQQKALLYGHWDVFEGQFFSEWNPDKHVIDPFPIPNSWKRFVGIDYGFHAPFAAIWFAVDNDGKVYAYRELYGSKMNPEEQARTVLAMSTDPSDGSEEHIDWFAADPSMWSRIGGGEPFAHVFDRHGITLTPSNNSRPAGWALMHDMLMTDKLVFFKNCVNVIRTLPGLNHSRRNPDDLDTLQEDHCFIGGTQIATYNGEKNIKDLRVGDLVLTRRGFAPIIKTHSRETNVSTLRLSDGSSITGTPTHKVMTERGWVPLGLLRKGDILWQNQSPSFSMASLSAVIPILLDGVIVCITALMAGSSKRERSRFMWKSGKQLMVQCLKAFTCIISMVIRSTTTSVISKLFPRGSISQRTAKSVTIARQNSELSLTESDPSQKNGTHPKKDGRGIGTMQRISKKILSFTLIAFARFAQLSRRLLAHKQSERSSVAPTAKPPLFVVGVESQYKNERVYNITVAGTHEFFANGILVANCADAIRYFLLTLRGFKTPNRQNIGDPDLPKWWDRVQKNRKMLTVRTTL